MDEVGDWVKVIFFETSRGSIGSQYFPYTGVGGNVGYLPNVGYLVLNSILNNISFSTDLINWEVYGSLIAFGNLVGSKLIKFYTFSYR